MYLCMSFDISTHELFIDICIYTMLYYESFGSIWLFTLQVTDLSLSLYFFYFLLTLT